MAELARKQIDQGFPRHRRQVITDASLTAREIHQRAEGFSIRRKTELANCCAGCSRRSLGVSPPSVIHLPTASISREKTILLVLKSINSALIFKRSRRPVNSVARSSHWMIVG